jgi:hypothetical protein
MFGMTEKEVCLLGRAGLVDDTDGSLSSVLQQRDRTVKIATEGMDIAIRKGTGHNFLAERQYQSVFYRCNR